MNVSQHIKEISRRKGIVCQTRLRSKKKKVRRFVISGWKIRCAIVCSYRVPSILISEKKRKKKVRRNESTFVLGRLDGPWYCKKNPRAVYSLFVATRSRVITLEFETTLTPAAVPQFSNSVLPFSRTRTMSTQLPSASGPWKTIRTFLFLYPCHIFRLSTVQSH